MAVTKKKTSFDELSVTFPVRFPVLLQSPFIQLDTNESVQLKNILYCTGDNTTTTFYTRTTKPVIVAKPLTHFERLLRNYGFKRINRQVINLTHILRFCNGQAYNQLELLGGEKIAISPAMKKSLVDALKRFALKEKSIPHQKWELVNKDYIRQDMPTLTDLVPDKLFYLRESSLIRPRKQGERLAPSL